MKTIELVIFKFKKGITKQGETRFLEITDALLKSCEGFVDRTYARDEEGNRADMVQWETMADGRAASEKMMKNPTALEVFGLIDASCMKLYHFRYIHETKREG